MCQLEVTLRENLTADHGGGGIVEDRPSKKCIETIRVKIGNADFVQDKIANCFRLNASCLRITNQVAQSSSSKPKQNKRPRSIIVIDLGQQGGNELASP